MVDIGRPRPAPSASDARVELRFDMSRTRVLATVHFGGEDGMSVDANAKSSLSQHSQLLLRDASPLLQVCQSQTTRLILETDGRSLIGLDGSSPHELYPRDFNSLTGFNYGSLTRHRTEPWSLVNRA